MAIVYFEDQIISPKKWPWGFEEAFRFRLFRKYTSDAIYSATTRNLTVTTDENVTVDNITTDPVIYLSYDKDYIYKTPTFVGGGVFTYSVQAEAASWALSLYDVTEDLEVQVESLYAFVSGGVQSATTAS